MMEWLTTQFNEDFLIYWEEVINDYFMIFALCYLAIELVIYAVKKKFSFQLLGDTVTNFVTLFAFLTLAFLFFGVYLGTLYGAYEYFSVTQLPITPWTIALAILIADFIYYWEHRFMHRVGLGWATHTVHHSSPHFNISVAYRFGPLDGIMPLIFHLPMAMLGFNPFLILFAEMVVQLYQTALHTEVVKKLPKWFEAVMNTPSHHRVHHGSNPEYIDKNYAGILIIWDKMFGTFEPEVAPVVYGLTKPINSVNPIKVFFQGFVKLFGQMFTARSFSDAMKYMVKPPGWEPDASKTVAKTETQQAET